MKKTIITILLVLLLVLSYKSIGTSLNYLVSSNDSGSENNNLWAVLITVGEPSLDNINAGALYDILTNNGWPENNIYKLIEDDATKESILSISDWLNDNGVEKDDLVLFYFSMHGNRTEDVPPIDEPDGLDEFVIAYNNVKIFDEELAVMFDEIQTENLTIIFESCYSGGMIDGSNDLKKSGRIVLTSTDVNETSYPYSLFFSKNGYLFPYYFIEGLRGPAEKNNDGYISVEEAYEYAKIYTIERSTFFAKLLYVFHKTLENHIQHPQIYDGWPSEENNQSELKLISHNNAPAKPTCSYDKDNNQIIVSSTDGEGDKIKYGVSWDNDGNVDYWTAFYNSGEEARIGCGENKGIVGVIAEDKNGAQSPWNSVGVNSRAKTYPVLTKLSDVFPNVFPILRFLLKL
jgi:hypothetical protein